MRNIIFPDILRVCLKLRELVKCSKISHLVSVLMLARDKKDTEKIIKVRRGELRGEEDKEESVRQHLAYESAPFLVINPCRWNSFFPGHQEKGGETDLIAFF